VAAIITSSVYLTSFHTPCRSYPWVPRGPSDVAPEQLSLQILPRTETQMAPLHNAKRIPANLLERLLQDGSPVAGSESNNQQEAPSVIVDMQEPIGLSAKIPKKNR